MTQFRKISIPLLTLAFIWILVKTWPSAPVLAAVFGALLVAVASVNFILYRNLVRQPLDLTLLLLPELWILATATVAFLQQTFLAELAVAVAGALVFIQLELRLDLKAQSRFIENVSFLSVVGLILAVWVVNFHYLPPWWATIGAMAAVLFLGFWMEFYSAPSVAREKLLFSALLAYLAAQVTWGMLYWPAHFITLTAAMAGLYYLALLLSRFYLMGALTRKKIIFHSVFVSCVELIVLATAMWLPKP